MYFDLTIILDRGLSYEALVPLLDPAATPVVLRQNGTITLNPFDTQGLPLTSEHVARLAALTAQMCGSTGDENAGRLRRAMLAKFSQQLCDDGFEEWSRRHPEELDAVARLATVLQRRHAESPDTTWLDRFIDYRDWAAQQAEAAEALLRQVSEAEVLQMLNEPATRRVVRDLAFARFRKDNYPTLRMLQELLQLDASAADRPLAHELALLLAPWCADGSHGPLFDGPTNLTLDGSLLYFELGQIAESAVELKTAANALIQGWIWQRIYTLPRSRRKRMIIEEAAAFLDMPGAAEIVQRAYEQARKYNTWLLTVFQQYAPLRTSPIRAAVLGNSQQFFILKQNDAEDLGQLAADLGLSRTAVEAILSYPKPEQAGYSAFTYFHRDTPHPVCATAYHRPSPEMAYFTNTTGAHVERRRQEFRGRRPNPFSVPPNPETKHQL